MRESQIDSRILPTDGSSVVYGETARVEGALTVLIYGHYDVKPPEPLDAWDSEPYEAEIRNGRMYGRGAADNKGQLYAHVKAVESVLAVNGRLPINVKLLFEGEEEILRILNSAPKFGNDNDYVDSIVNEVITHFSNEVSKYPATGGAISNANAGAGGIDNLVRGLEVGATPEGRRAREPLVSGLSPQDGRNVSGPTSTMRSITKLDHLKLSGGSVVNMRFSQDALKDETKIRKFAFLLRTYFETGAYHVQFNITSTDTLRAAQRHPEKYRDLLVRVATYTAYFIDLDKEAQDAIIARTEFQEV